MSTATFAADTKIVTHTVFESTDSGALSVELKIDDNGDGSFSIDDPDDEAYIQKPVEDLDLLIAMLTAARTIRDQLRLHEDRSEL
jgi:hypothetical protein